MDINSVICPSKWDEVDYNNGVLTISDNSNTVEIRESSIVKEIALKYLKDADDKELEEIWKEIYDSPSYYEIDKENFSLKAQIDELKETTEQLKSKIDALRARR
ncbi:hypothetical protein KYB31_09360 [Clostridium felsineum]|uniref:hypothetical protein n=1 Tax=Clostridium felsineum TaxID=36839 RepID=UPI00214DA143|nr:hypothetical protein [Clostridium felsineum]MCR3759196.1 hypothetical protein [Clostridium felsineum]